ncbi:hypothetical protein L6452_39709 [Arctium lappa]|uniref:Uncharacterized protein n=1 Tax=Arctium lappa TaxID=4217 RepID=A0ACB8XTR7_ARCLA|nr:hypothetical protein L6452_39709 [Arctium lappa]
MIIQCEPPRDVEDYIHRSGRTGRAGNFGVAITLYEPRRSNISKLEREAGVKFEHISSPQPADIAKAAGADAADVAKAIIQVADSFSDVTERVLHSEIFKVGKVKWRLLIYPEGNGEGARKWLSIFLEIHDVALLPNG